MWIFLLGPFLSLLPERWRKALPFYQAVHWRSAAILSGLAESVIALGGAYVLVFVLRDDLGFSRPR